ncbi:hypothetical protein S7711_06820 [Stachybotrys chartarum IBT 7711]|uniref:Zn(2)-C6 fungal-type domain-containing protein n=1 Tax=Stachybotrys chartarum (strain CBS 109288 / IBT 7711) TaxID=1280523 RepID=A0A084AYG7_STACB|nr:hypothetical protein S7711_06820 [Stachybotrys chartarum IBT 7711]KFA50402.1 hypothetical protein S40293_05213 [Stachybotrys chartarum IBT 40293]KFA74715.1 hypothetical protein S40288_03944 [Stachybotrys chartarum IBT 40288]
MFNTWKYDPETDEVQSLRQAFDPISARSSQHQACDRCHEKKLKCSGEKDGCDRCVAAQKLCEYTRSGTRSSRRGSKKPSSRRGLEEASPSRHRRSSRGHGGSSSRHAASAGPAISSAEESEGMLNTLDFSMLNPDDAFDLTSLSESSAHHAATSGGGSSMAPAYSYHQAHYYQAPHQIDSYSQWQPPSHYVSSGATGASVTATADAAYAHAQTQYQYHDYHQQPDPRYWPQRR